MPGRPAAGGVTDVRRLSPRLAEATVGPGARVVPLRRADAALLDLIRPGDVVDALAAHLRHRRRRRRAARVVATDAVVVLVSEKVTSPGRGDDRVVLVALPLTPRTKWLARR